MIATIFREAFSPQAMYGGFLGVLVMGVRRAAFSNEAGLGSAAFAHAAAKTNEPAREGMVAIDRPLHRHYRDMLDDRSGLHDHRGVHRTPVPIKR